MYQNYKNIEFVKPGGLELKDRLVGVQRVTKVTKGGRTFGFSAIVVVGDENGVVGLWFISNNGLLFISKDSPKWLVGPGTINTNPLGGIFGICLMIIFCFFYLLSFKKKIRSFK